MMAVGSSGRLSDARKGTGLTSPSKQSRGFLGSIFSVSTRLLTWYCIITILLRCPNTAEQVTDTSPKICKPYFQARSIIAPHIEPYYTTYAAPYVDTVRPYYEKLDQVVITPTVTFAKTHGAPQLMKAQAVGQAKWEEIVQPQLARLSDQAKGQYNQNLAPHVNKISDAASPYYSKSRDTVVDTYNARVLPAYTTVRPYAETAYSHGSNFVVNTGIPSLKWAWATSASFMERAIWPRVRILYGESVEPQLVRIGERLGRYKDRKNIQAVVEGVDRSIASSYSEKAVSSTSIISTTPPPAAQTVAPPITPSASSASSSTNTPLSSSQDRSDAQKIVQEDLRTWQEKFAKAADHGSDELEERVTEITERLIQSQANGVGEARLVELEETVKAQLKSLKKTILSIVSTATPEDIEDAEEKLGPAVRKAGVAIRDKAQAIRNWRQSYDRELSSLVSAAAEETFNILDHIRDLGLQEMGMRWAWTEGITHKDWAKYHALKHRFDEWRGDVEAVVIEHEGLIKASSAAEDVEARAMAIAEDAVKELTELKETARYKLYHGDTSDDLTPQKLPAGTVLENKLPEPEPEPESESESESEVDDESEGVLESAKGAAAAALSSASSVISKQGETILGQASDKSGSMSSSVSSASSAASSIAADEYSSLASVSASSIPISSDTVYISSIASEKIAEASAFASKHAENIAEQAAKVKSKVEEFAAAEKESATSLASAASSEFTSMPHEAISDAQTKSFESESTSTVASEAEPDTQTEPETMASYDDEVELTESVTSTSTTTVTLDTTTSTQVVEGSVDAESPSSAPSVGETKFAHAIPPKVEL